MQTSLRSTSSNSIYQTNYYQDYANCNQQLEATFSSNGPRTNFVSTFQQQQAQQQQQQVERSQDNNNLECSINLEDQKFNHHHIETSYDQSSCNRLSQPEANNTCYSHQPDLNQHPELQSTSLAQQQQVYQTQEHQIYLNQTTQLDADESQIAQSQERIEPSNYQAATDCYNQKETTQHRYQTTIYYESSLDFQHQLNCGPNQQAREHHHHHHHQQQQQQQQLPQELIFLNSQHQHQQEQFVSVDQQHQAEYFQYEQPDQEYQQQQQQQCQMQQSTIYHVPQIQEANLHQLLPATDDTNVDNRLISLSKTNHCQHDHSEPHIASNCFQQYHLLTTSQSGISTEQHYHLLVSNQQQQQIKCQEGQNCDSRSPSCSVTSVGESQSQFSSEESVSTNANSSSSLTRDEKRARRANIPLSYNEIVNLSIEQFNEQLARHKLTESQLTLIKDIRRRGKNKVAAQSCRKRKMEQIYELQQEVGQLMARRRQMVAERAHLAKEQASLMSDYDKIYNLIQEELQRERENKVI